MKAVFWQRVWLAAGLLVLIPALAAQTQLRTFDLQHRSAEELIPLLRPLVDPQGAVSGTGQTLVVRSDPQNLAELESAIASLDTPRRQLLISVRQSASERAARRGGSVSGRVGSGDVDVIVGEDGRRGDGVSARVHGSRSHSDEHLAQRLRVSEGGWARIDAGEAVPVPQQSITRGPGGTIVQRTYEYRDVQSGFEVRPRLTGDGRVSLDVRPFRARRSSEGGGIIEQQELVTSVSGRLGEWLAIGGSVDKRQDDRSGIASSAKTSERTTRRVFVRVDVLDR